MLIIREEQMEAFRAAVRERFEERLSAHVTEKYGFVQSDATLTLVRGSIAKAEQYGLTMERSIVVLAELMVEEGQDFDSHPDRALAREILADRELPEGARMHLLLAERPWTAPPAEAVLEEEV